MFHRRIRQDCSHCGRRLWWYEPLVREGKRIWCDQLCWIKDRKPLWAKGKGYGY